LHSSDDTSDLLLTYLLTFSSISLDDTRLWNGKHAEEVSDED